MKDHLRLSVLPLLGFALGACSTSPQASHSVRDAGSSGSGGLTGTGGDTNGTAAGGSTGTGGSGPMGTGAGGAVGGVTDGGSGGATPIDAANDAVQGPGGIDASSDAVRSIEPAANFLCGNWADTRDNFVNGNLELSGLSAATDTYATVLAKSDAILAGFQTVAGANSVRLPINEPTVLGPWWNAYKGTIDAAVARGMKVIVAYWAWHNGQLDDLATFNSMWDTVVSAYATNNLVYFEIFNEPWGYTAPQWIEIAAPWVARHADVPKGRIVVAGSYSDTDVRLEGADPRFNGTLLSLHIYPFNNATQTAVQGWTTLLQTNLGSYGSRVIVTEWGAPMTTGTDYSVVGEGNHNGSFITALSTYLHDNKMGSCYWPVLRTNDAWSLTTLNGTGANLTLTVTNASGLARVQSAFNL